jgi:hypothetical protein
MCTTALRNAASATPGDAAEDGRTTVATKFEEFARAHAVGPDKAGAAARGAFAAMPGAVVPDLFGSLDLAYAAYILDVLPGMTDRSGRRAWAEHILSFQGEDGWFRASDRQGHGKAHATAYALGGLLILAQAERDLLERLKPLAGFQSEIERHPGRDVAPFRLSLLDRTHFWRGSHRAGGLAAIVGSIQSLGLSSERLLAIHDPKAWLEGWWAWFAHRLEPRTGYWRLSFFPVQTGFDLLYRRRHDPALAAMGGAVHLYWVSERMGVPQPYPAEVIRTTAALLRSSGLYEDEPYCIDLDGNFMIGRALAGLAMGDPAGSLGRDALRQNREAVLGWYRAKPVSDWNPNTHKLPGALAAVAEADRVLRPGDHRNWRDVFRTTWWL